MPDPQAPGNRGNPFGEMNSILKVASSPETHMLRMHNINP